MDRLRVGDSNGSGEAPTIAQLQSECHRLIEIVARRPGAAKLLLGVRFQLRLFAAYKANRKHGDRPKPYHPKPYHHPDRVKSS